MKLKNRLTIAVTLCLVLLSAVMVLAVRSRNDATQPLEPGAEQTRFEVERVTLREWGFEPAKISRGPGPFHLIVQNQSGLQEIEISLVEESGRPRNRLPDLRNALTTNQRLNLPPGTYLLREVGHPDWECRITISR